jgi:Uma2 family endonuclease
MTPTEALAPPPAPVQVADSESLYEVVGGKRVEPPPLGVFETSLAAALMMKLATHAEAHRLGRIVFEMLFLLNRDTDLQRRPDVAFVSFDRWPRNRRVPRTAAWDVIPDLAVEVVSPTNTVNEVTNKVRDYFAAGVRLVWVVLPELEQVYVYSSLTAIEVVTRTGHLDGGTVLPGLRLPLTAVFEDVEGE